MRNNVLRGKLLRFLYDTRPDKVEKMTLFDIFYEYFKTDAIEKEVEYLVSKKYVAKMKKPHPYKKAKMISLYEITASGVDLIEGLEKDDGVSVVVECE